MDPVDEEISAFRKELKSQTVSILKELNKQFTLWFTPHKAEQPLEGMKLQEKETQKD